MTQYQDPFAQPYVDPAMQPKKTSGLAITALVFSLLGIIPCCGAVFAPIGALLGLIGAAILGPRAAKKGRGMSIVALILSVIFCVGHVASIKWGYEKMWLPVKVGPSPALTAGFAGDVAAFRNSFYGPGATASDAEAQAFLDTLKQRYGSFVSARMNEQSSQQPQFGQPKAVFPYILEFQNKTVDADAEMVFSDPQKGGLIMKLGFITVRDPDAGDLTFPPPAANP